MFLFGKVLKHNITDHFCKDFYLYILQNMLPIHVIWYNNFFMLKIYQKLYSQNILNSWIIVNVAIYHFEWEVWNISKMITQWNYFLFTFQIYHSIISKCPGTCLNFCYMYICCILVSIKIMYRFGSCVSKNSSTIIML